jgi:hypothetical protein
LRRLIGALFFPDRAFRSQDALRVPASVLVFVLFLLFLCGARLSMEFQQNPVIHELAIREAQKQAEQFMFGAPPEARVELERNIVRSLTGDQAPVVQSLSLIVSAGLFALLAAEIWALLNLLSQFFGGEEVKADGSKHGASLHLVLYAWFPLAFRELLRGVILIFEDPAHYANVLTLAEFRALSRVRFSPLDIAGLTGLDGLGGYLAYNLTDPFFLWMLAILWIGVASIYRLSRRKALGEVAVLLVILTAQHELLRQVGMELPV